MGQILQTINRIFVNLLCCICEPVRSKFLTDYRRSKPAAEIVDNRTVYEQLKQPSSLVTV